MYESGSSDPKNDDHNKRHIQRVAMLGFPFSSIFSNAQGEREREREILGHKDATGYTYIRIQGWPFFVLSDRSSTWDLSEQVITT